MRKLKTNKFRYREDVEQWLEPMDYRGFWVAVAPYDLVLQRREHCDQMLASGELEMDTAMDVLKNMALIELCEKFELVRKPIPPRLTLVDNH